MVEAVSQSFNTSSVVLSTRVYSVLAGTMVRLGVLPPKLNPVIKPIMDSIKREVGFFRKESGRGYFVWTTLSKNLEKVQFLSSI